VIVAHFVCFCMAVWVVGPVWDMLCCILCLSRVRRAGGMLLLWAMRSICRHSFCCCSVFSGSVSIYLMRNL
jgi:hypothetical protein